MEEFRRRLEATFEHLANDGYSVTSDGDPRYNCIAWAAGDSARWWEPIPWVGQGLAGGRLYYWPARTALSVSVAAYLDAFRTLGYEECASEDLESGFEKIALYAARGIPTHAARQLRSGEWTSKLWQWEDITHTTVQGVAGKVYGEVVRCMRRPL